MTCPSLVDRPIDVPPHAVDLHIRLVDKPPITRRVPSKSGRISEQGRKPSKSIAVPRPRSRTAPSPVIATGVVEVVRPPLRPVEHPRYLRE